MDPAAQAWAVTQNTTSRAVLDDFIRQFSNTVYGSMARARLQELNTSQVAMVAPPVPPPVVPPSSSGPCAGNAVTVSLSSRLACPLSANEERGLKPKDSFKECADCPEMVVVPAGSFLMGSPAGEPSRYDDEVLHKVTFKASFAVGKFAVTFSQWEACVADGGCNGYRPSDAGWGRGLRPAINVSWEDAQAYTSWLSKTAGHEYRLLSEAEREYVTRAGTTTPFWTGTTITEKQANFRSSRTVPVDRFDPNPWGLYQLHGNVFEWTGDCVWTDWTIQNPPTDGSASNKGECDRRIVRGGHYADSKPKALRAAVRIGGYSKSERDPRVGFRVARPLIGSAAP
jgi:formylglycine-generating enzyme required for sulfatase activity